MYSLQPSRRTLPARRDSADLMRGTSLALAPVSQPRKESHDVVDDLRDPADPLAPGNGERGDPWRGHPPPAHPRARRGADARHPGTATHLSVTITPGVLRWTCHG